MRQLPFSEACERNKQAILDVLRNILPAHGRILEIGSCTGQHLVFFAAHLRRLQWQPSDCSEYLGGLTDRIELEGGENVLAPVELDVLGRWPGQVFNAVYSANTAHIMSWAAVCAMFAGLETHLAPDSVFCLYGPFNQDGRFTAESNESFDRQLRARCSHMGLRDVEALESLAIKHHMHPAGRHAMPANNQLLVFRRAKECSNE